MEYKTLEQILEKPGRKLWIKEDGVIELPPIGYLILTSDERGNLNKCSINGCRISKWEFFRIVPEAENSGRTIEFWFDHFKSRFPQMEMRV